MIRTKNNCQLEDDLSYLTTGTECRNLDACFVFSEHDPFY